MTSAGHRALPHTADLRLEAWAPTPDLCVAHAVQALVESFARVPDGVATQSQLVDLPIDSLDELLVSVLDEVVFLVDARGLVPIRSQVSTDGRVRFDLAPLDQTEIVGATPKAVTWHDLRFERRDGGWWCAVTIDV
jgi:SHS2 domain-containing protein